MYTYAIENSLYNACCRELYILVVVMKRSLEYLFGVISFGLLLALFLPSIAMRVHAADPGSFEIFPKASSVNEAGNNIYGQYVEELGKNKKADFWKVYNDRADEFSNSKDI